MKILMIAILLIMITSIYVLIGGSNVYTLQSESSDHKDVVRWIYNEKVLSAPIPVGRSEIQLPKKKLNFTSDLTFESETGSYIGTIEFLGEKRNPDLHVKWFSADGTARGEFIDTRQYDDPVPVYKIHPETGNLIAVDLYANVRIINTVGKIINQFKILPEYNFSNENVVYTQLVNDLLVSALCEVKSGKDNTPAYKSSVRVIDLQGQLSMQYDQSGWQLQALGVSPDGENIVVSLYRWTDSPGSEIQFNTLILDESGEMLYQIPIGFQKLVFNDDKSRLLLIDKNAGYLIDLHEKQLKGSYSTLEDNSLFLTAVFLSPSETFVLQEGKPAPGIPGSLTPWKYETIYIRTLFDQDEELDPLLVENITLFKPSLHYNKENQTLFIGHSTGWKLYKVEK